MLKNLDTLFNEMRKKYRQEASTNDILLIPEFQKEYKRVLPKLKNGFSVEFNPYSAIIKTSKGQKIFISSQWFTQAVWWVPYVKALQIYQELANKAYNRANLDPEFRKTEEKKFAFFQDYRDRKISEKRVQLFKQVLKQTLIESGSQNVEQDYEYLERSLRDYAWWHGGKAIVRGDAHQSAILSTMNVQNESSTFMAEICLQIASDPLLEKAAFQMIHQSSKPQVQLLQDDSLKIENRKTGGVNLILYGAPGTGKSYQVHQRYGLSTHSRRVVFHPEYSSAKFVGSYKPISLYAQTDYKIQDRAGKPFLYGEPKIDYHFVPGPFIKSLVDAWLDPAHMHTLIIEEINRAHTLAVFADVFQLLDRVDNGESMYSLELSEELNQYLLSIPGMELYIKDGLKIPSNFNLVATMNSTDQGVNSLDTAFRRRWSFEYLPISLETAPHKDQLLRYNQSEVTWGNFVMALNRKLKDHKVEEDRLIGPYFIKPEEVGKLQAMDKLLLYLWNDVLRYSRSSFFHPSIESFGDLSKKFEEIDVFNLNQEPYQDVLYKALNEEQGNK